MTKLYVPTLRKYFINNLATLKSSKTLTTIQISDHYFGWTSWISIFPHRISWKNHNRSN